MRTMLFLALAVGLLLSPWAAAAQQHSVFVVVLEKHNGELQTDNTAKAVLTNAVAKGGWNVADVKEYPLTVSGDDVNRFLARQNQATGKTAEYKGNELAATMSPAGEIRLNPTDASALNLSAADLRRLRWRLDLEKLQAAAQAAGARYLLYGEVTTRAVPKQDVAPDAAGETFGAASALGAANLRLIDVGSHSVLATFVDQAPAMQAVQAAADVAAAQGIAEKAGAYMVRQLAVASMPQHREAPPPASDSLIPNVLR
jgi:hypothetical protein